MTVRLDNTIERSRAELARRPGYRFVAWDEYLAMLLSPRTLRRADDESAHVRGLFDPLTGETCVIGEEDVLPPGVATRPGPPGPRGRGAS